MINNNWQEISIPTKEGHMFKCTVYEHSKKEKNFFVREKDENGIDCKLLGPHLHGKKTYDLDDPDSLCFSCTHDGDNCHQIYPSDINDVNSEMIQPLPCIHGQAVISFLKKKDEFKTQNIEPEEYTGEVIRIFEVRKKESGKKQPCSKLEQG